MNTLLKNENFFVLTGGPGVGKTTLLKALQKLGFHTVEEEARKIIKKQIKTHSHGLPWKNKKHYAKLMYEASVKSYAQEIAKKENVLTFFDRGLLDTIGYMNMENIPITAELIKVTKKHRYNKHVFILPPWQEIYTTDTERKQDWETAQLNFDHMKETYLAFGYTIIEVPKASLQERVTFILDICYGLT